MERPNLSSFKLNNHTGWIDRFLASMGEEEFDSYEHKVYNALNILKPGWCYDIVELIPENMRELFIKFCCMYIEYIDSEIFFNDDYTLVFRNKLPRIKKHAA